ncbi:MAG: hypothetical protein AB7E46_06530 [Desulfovibrio sp.]
MANGWAGAGVIFNGCGLVSPWSKPSHPLCLIEETIAANRSPNVFLDKYGKTMSRVHSQSSLGKAAKDAQHIEKSL